jgi:hypothetical protein
MKGTVYSSAAVETIRGPAAVLMVCKARGWLSAADEFKDVWDVYAAVDAYAQLLARYGVSTETSTNQTPYSG